jgi:hypothetical protein
VIDFRYHLVSIVAVFLALAIGIVLGSTELQGPLYNRLNNTTAKLQGELDQANSQRDTAQAQANEGEAYASAVEPQVLKGLLAGQRLLIVTEPGAQSSVVTGINAAAAYANATVTGQINLQSKFFDNSGTAQDSLNQTNQDVAQSTGIALSTGQPYQQQAAQVMATEILGKAAPTGTAQQLSTQQSDAQTMLAAYAQSNFLTTTGQPAAPATLVVVVTPQNAPSDGSNDPVDQMLVPVVQELAAKSAAVVVAGSSSGSGVGSPIAVLRSNNVANQVSTIDDADFVAGQSVVMEALATELGGGKTGSFGFTANGATAAAPSPVPAASAPTSATPSSSTSTKGKK